MIEYRELTIEDIDAFAAMRVRQLIEEAAREEGCGTVWVTASDMGVPFYASCGFVHNGNFMQCKL